MERGLIAWYEQLLDALLPSLGPDDGQRIAPIAAQPMQIRGFGPVKEAPIGKVKARVAALSGSLRG